MEINKFTPYTRTHAHIKSFSFGDFPPWSWASVFGFWCIANCFLLSVFASLSVLLSCLLLFLDLKQLFYVVTILKATADRRDSPQRTESAKERCSAFKINFFHMPFHFSIIEFWLFFFSIPSHISFFKYLYVDNILHFNCGFLAGRRAQTYARFIYI